MLSNERCHEIKHRISMGLLVEFIEKLFEGLAVTQVQCLE